eukprot:g3465.t1
MSLRAALADHIEQPRAHNQAPADVLEIWKRLEGVFFVEAELKPQHSEASRSCANATPDCALSGACVRLPRACVPGASTPAQLRWLCKLLSNIMHTDFERTGYSYTNRSGVLKEFLEVAAASGQENCFICLEAFEVLPDSQCRAMTCRDLPIAAQCGHCTHVGCLIKAATVAAPPPGATGQPDYVWCRKCRAEFSWTEHTESQLVLAILDDLAATYRRSGTTGSPAPTVDDAAAISWALWSRLKALNLQPARWMVGDFLEILVRQTDQSKESRHPVPLGFMERLEQEFENVLARAEESDSSELGSDSLDSSELGSDSLDSSELGSDSSESESDSSDLRSVHSDMSYQTASERRRRRSREEDEEDELAERDEEAEGADDGLVPGLHSQQDEGETE